MLRKIKKILVAEHRNDFPHFMIVGAQKAGTTALYTYLSKHPQIQPTKIKELHYFNCESRYKQGVSFYSSLFDFDSDEKLLFDASPGYLSHPDAPQRIYAHNPNVKVIIIVRDPVARAYSAWNMYRARYSANRNWFFDDWVSFCGDAGYSILRRQDDRLFNFFDYAIDEIELQDTGNGLSLLEAPIVFHGYYYEQIKKYMSLFSAQQLLVIENTELSANTRRCLQKIERFLGIPEYDWGVIDLSPVFQGDYSDMIEADAINLLSDHYANSNERLFDLLDKRYSWGDK